MKILNQEINSISFDDVVASCQEKQPEGIELDYKKDFPDKDLSRLIAAFSNTRGGLIIIGVTEDKQTGFPSSWDGISDDAGLIEKTNQLALAVSPLPDFKVRKTDEKNGKVFILIKVYEGDATPYFVKNDSNVWTRTGNIRNLVDIASPEWLDLLYRKRDRSEKARRNYITIADEVFKHGLALEEKLRIRLVEEAKLKGDGSENNYYLKKLGTDTEIFTITILPNYPRSAKVTPRDILENANIFRCTTDFTEFPKQNLRPIPDGVMATSHSFRGDIGCNQIYATGLLYNCFDVLAQNRETGKSVIYISHIIGGLFTTLKSAKLFYNYIGYQGVLKINLTLNLNSKDVNFYRLTGNDPFHWNAEEQALLPNYTWEFTLNTAELNDINEAFGKFFEMVDEIHWNLGFKTVSVELVKDFMKKNRLVF
ncbi:MAG: ATP-binding protein [candidate division WWE3 bacterium]|nr:ATP-binding protein [candidate division WWE3 bacterium]